LAVPTVKNKVTIKVQSSDFIKNNFG
jgi:hypothetical protein